MKYELIPARKENIELLINYKLKTIFLYASNLEEEEISRIKNYALKETQKRINDYKLITSDKKIIGAVLVYKHLDGVLLDEVYLEEDYQNKGIGTKIIEEIIANNKIVYLWVYKDNIKAVKLYEKLKFKVVEETETRYFMKCRY